VLTTLFQTVWEPAKYYRTKWNPVEANIQRVIEAFGYDHDYSAKACSLTNVPIQEQLFAVTSRSVTDFLVPAMNLSHSTAIGETAIAMHEYGAGSIAYFGDVNCEEQTVRNIVSFIRSQAPAQASIANGTPLGRRPPAAEKAAKPPQSPKGIFVGAGWMQAGDYLSVEVETLGVAAGDPPKDLMCYACCAPLKKPCSEVPCTTCGYSTPLYRLLPTLEASRKWSQLAQIAVAS
jgi:hypothetical protein